MLPTIYDIHTVNIEQLYVRLIYLRVRIVNVRDWRHTQTRPRLYVSDLSLSDALQRFVLGDPADVLSRPDGSSGVCCW